MKRCLEAGIIRADRHGQAALLANALWMNAPNRTVPDSNVKTVPVPKYYLL